MRLFFLATLLVGVATSAAAQQAPSPFSRGKTILSGRLSLTTSEVNDVRVTAFSFASSARYFIRPGLAIGGSLSMGLTSSDRIDTRSFGIGGEGSYFFGTTRGEEVRGRLFPFVSAEVRYSRSFSESEVIRLPPPDRDDPPQVRRTETTTNSIDSSGGVGVLYMLSSAVGVSMQAQYQVNYRLSQNIDLGAPAQPSTSRTTTLFGLFGGLTVFL